MTVAATPTIRARLLGGELRKARETAGFTLDDAARFLGVNKATMSRIELGRSGVRQRDVRQLLDEYGVTTERTIETLVRLSKHGRQQGWWKRHGEVVDAEYGDVLGLETQAKQIRTYEHSLIPGLLQTSAYSDAVLGASVVDRTPQQIEGLTSVRRERQVILTRDKDPIVFSAVIAESAIRMRVGGPIVMAEQLEKLLAMGSRHGVSIQVAPHEIGAHAAIASSFVIYSFDALPDIDIVYSELLPSAVYHEQAHDTALYRRAFESVSADALSPRKSAELIESVMKELRS
jgi:transcriptional regulator with XRE-family HTH domain